MLRLKLINKDRYSRKRKYRAYLVHLHLLLCFASMAWSYNPWIILLVWLVPSVLFFILFFIIEKRTLPKDSRTFMEMDEYALKVTSEKGGEPEIIPWEKVDTLFVKEEYSFPGETAKELWLEMAGKIKNNYFVLEMANNKRRFDFEFDSLYRIKQLENVLDKCREKGLHMKLVK